jgi:hypothetical protein
VALGAFVWVKQARSLVKTPKTNPLSGGSQMLRLSISTLVMAALATLFSVSIAEQAFAQQSQNPYFFGMNVRLVRDGFGRASLQITSVTPGGPAQAAGLEVGDQIRRLNGQDFSLAQDSFEAVRMMNYFVDAGGGDIAPAAPASAGAQVLVDPGFRQATAQMNVVDIRTGGNVCLTVYPRPNFTSPGGPDIAPAAAASRQQQVQAARPWNR